MFTSSNVNEVLATLSDANKEVFIKEMRIKPTCPDCSGNCKKENAADSAQSPFMIYRCKRCRTWVYQPEWIEK